LVRPDQYFSGTKFRSFSAARSSYLGHGPKDATAHTFGQRLDGAAVAGGIPSLEYDDGYERRSASPNSADAMLYSFTK
jgi:hypothetical protein